MNQAPPPPPPVGGGVMPQRGVFATSEIVPMISSAAAEMRRRHDAWLDLRRTADEARAYAKKVRADLIVTLRVFGNEGTASMPIKTSAERNEWANADGAVQQAELDADLAQTVQMAAREAYNDAQGQFAVLQSLLAIERDEMKREHAGPPQ